MIYICSKCKREFKRKGNLDVHFLNCNGINNSVIKKKVIDKTSINKEKKEVECIKSKTGKHDLVVMNGINPMQKNAMKSGYVAFCRICGELV
jgi:hypothetical protein